MYLARCMLDICAGYFVMRCVIHVRRSFDLSGEHFVLRLYPQFRSEKRRAETFTSARSLVKRLTALGVPEMDPWRSFPDLGGNLDAVWTNIDVPGETFEEFGRMVGRTLESKVAA
jgi:hypothetical protein